MRKSENRNGGAGMLRLIFAIVVAVFVLKACGVM